MNANDRNEWTGAVTLHGALSSLAGDERSWDVDHRLATAITVLAIASVIAFFPCVANAADNSPDVLGIPVDFILFAITLIGVGLFHHHVRSLALSGPVAIVGYRLAFTGFQTGAGLTGLSVLFAHEDSS